MRRPRLLDLFSGAGGSAVGYYRAGFDVVGVDIRPQPHYPFEHHVADALTFPLDGFDAVHASPPCQAYSRATVHKENHPDLLDRTRRRLATQSAPWVIENVPLAPMRVDLKLCGCMFDLPGLMRTRWFETSWSAFELRQSCYHAGPIIDTMSSHGKWWRIHGHVSTRAEIGRAMGIDWMSRDELRQAIPPAYTEYVGNLLLDHLRAGVAS